MACLMHHISFWTLARYISRMIKVVEDQRAIEKLHRQFLQKIADELTERIECWVGFPGGNFLTAVNYSKELNIWVASNEQDTAPAFRAETKSSLEKYDTIKRNTEYFAYDHSKTLNIPSSSMHLVSTSFKHEILSILFKKGISILKPIVFNAGDVEKTASNAITHLAFDTIYKIDGKKDNPVNNPEMFDHFSDLILDCKENSYSDYVLDYDNCLNLVKLIERTRKKTLIDEELFGL